MASSAPKVDVDVTPSVLIWARESIGLSREEAAKRLQMTELDLRFLEEGVGDVSMSRLKRMSDVYQRPLLAFFLPEPPTEPESTIPDFRLVPENRGKPWTPELHEAYRRVLGQRLVALELADPETDPVPEIELHLSLADDEEQAGERVRAWLEPPAAFPASGDYAIFNTWAGLIEGKGVLVTQVSNVSTEEMRGFSIGEHPLPVIALNGADTIRGRLFTLMHELTHILLHRSGLCDLEDEFTTPDAVTNRLEVFCNAVAAAILMPRQALLNEPLVVRSGTSSTWSDEDLSFLAGRFGVSKEAMLRRLLSLRRTSAEFYREKRLQFLALYRLQRRSGRITYYRKMIRNLGRRYITTVWQAYQRGDIDEHDVASYLQVQLPNVPTLIERMRLEG